MRRFTMRRLGKRLLRSQLGGRASGISRRKKAEEKEKQTRNQQYSKPPQIEQDIFEKAIARGLTSHGIFSCSKCNYDVWAVVKRRLIFWTADIMYCEHCKIPLEQNGKMGYINFKEFKEEITTFSQG